MKILVTGAAGYVGGFAARHLLASGHDVIAIDDLRQGHSEAFPRERLVVGDVGDRELLDRVMAEHSVEGVMHFAASTSVAESVSDPGLHYRNNVANTLELLDAMMRHDVRRIVFSSTAATYGDTGSEPLREDAPKQPTSPYGSSKLAIETMIQDYSRAHGLGFGILRYFNAAGASTDGQHGEDHTPETHLIPLVMQTLLGQRDSLQVFGDDWDTPDGTCVRDYVHVEDLAEAHKKLIEALPAPSTGGEATGHIYNVGVGRGATVLEVIRAVEQVSGKKVPYRMAPRRDGDPATLVACSDRLRAELAWTPRYETIESIVETAWAWHESHPHGYASR